MKEMSTDRPVPLRTKAFEGSVLEAERPVLVAFTAVWCAPCGWLKPYLEEFAAGSGGRLGVFTVDVDDAPEIAERFSIGSVPTVLFFRGGAEVARSVGVEPARLHALVDSLTAPDTSA